MKKIRPPLPLNSIFTLPMTSDIETKSAAAMSAPVLLPHTSNQSAPSLPPLDQIQTQLLPLRHVTSNQGN